MNRRLAAVTARIARTVRGQWPDRNPLRRRTDRIEAAVAGGLAVAFLAGAPVAAVAAHRTAYTLGARQVQAQQSWRRVPAVLLADAPLSGYASSPVRARWTSAAGASRTATVFAPAGARAGSTVTVWLDTSGRPAGEPPLRLSQVRATAVLAGVLAALLLGETLLIVGAAVNWQLKRRRLAAWASEWQATEPQWTNRKNA